MPKAKKKSLPKDFEALLDKGDVEELKRLFDIYDVNARGGASKQSALAFRLCPDDLSRWLVENGADLHAYDTFLDTPLHTQAKTWNGRVDVLLELGADVNRGEGFQGTPLHAAAGVCNPVAAALLLQYGARVDALDRKHQTPLARALAQCTNAHIERMAPLTELLLAAGAQQTPDMKASVVRIGMNFEFFRDRFNPDHVAAASAALERLYVLFDVPPVPRRIMHDGKSPIVARSADWQDQHEELWHLLVPPKGAAGTVQGEVVRISGRISDELMRNGGRNWDASYVKMADAFLVHIASGTPLDQSLLDEARGAVAEAKNRRSDAAQLCELAVRWIALNPTPMTLSPPDYTR